MNDVLVGKIADCLIQQGKRVVCAESCTAGGVSYSLTSISGSSQWFHQAYITYSNQSKTDLLGVEPGLIEKFGAVSEPVVREMLIGAVTRSGADCGVAVSGIAGPGGAAPGKPVGTVCIAWGGGDDPKSMSYLFKGDRALVREQAIKQALLNLLHYLAP